MSTEGKKTETAKTPETPTEKPWQGYREDQVSHPDQVIRDHVKDDPERYEEFMLLPFDDWVFNLWSTWLSIILRADISEIQVTAYRAALRERKFTNRDVIYCCQFFEGNSIYFPMVSDWVTCPDLPRVQEHDRVLVPTKPQRPPWRRLE